MERSHRNVLPIVNPGMKLQMSLSRNICIPSNLPSSEGCPQPFLGFSIMTDLASMSPLDDLHDQAFLHSGLCIQEILVVLNVRHVP